MQLHGSVADVQNSPDKRNLPVNRVGIRRLRHPIVFQDQPSIAMFDMFVDLPKEVKGTHMSRFIEILNEQKVVLTIPILPALIQTMVTRLNAQQGFLEIQFPYFIDKAAPISQTRGLLDYDVRLSVHHHPQQTQVFVTVIIPVTSLCPCSKEISDYGAHNQRSHVSITAEVLPNFSLNALIQCVEKTASCELYSVLKRQDEKWVTEQAYNNPKFVEDMVRDVAVTLDNFQDIKGYKISAENFESIHNHSAYAEIDLLQSPSSQKGNRQVTKEALWDSILLP